MSKTRCSACGKKWTDHKGVEPTCAILQSVRRDLHLTSSALRVAFKSLLQISSMPRNTQARRNAIATLAFLETQLG